MLNIYAWSFRSVGFVVLTASAIWLAAKSLTGRKLWRVLNAAFALAALVMIARYTVLGRTHSEVHSFIFAAWPGPEFYREMVMNAFLYFPLGLSLTELAGGRSVLFALLLSLSVEAWQYFAGAGIAQGTDVIMNTLGCAVGAIPALLSRNKE